MCRTFLLALLFLSLSQASSFQQQYQVKPSPSAQNRATLYYNCARASANMGRQLEALKSCNHALGQVPKYLSALEQRAKSQLALYNYKVRKELEEELSR